MTILAWGGMKGKMEIAEFIVEQSRSFWHIGFHKEYLFYYNSVYWEG